MFAFVCTDFERASLIGISFKQASSTLIAVQLMYDLASRCDTVYLIADPTPKGLSCQEPFFLSSLFLLMVLVLV